MPYWIIAVSIFPILLVGAIYRVRTQPQKAVSIIQAGLLGGAVLILGYAAYALLFHSISPVEVMLGQSDPNQVKNIWGQKNFFYTVPFGYVFLACGATSWVVHRVSSS